MSIQNTFWLCFEKNEFWVIFVLCKSQSNIGKIQKIGAKGIQDDSLAERGRQEEGEGLKTLQVCQKTVEKL